MDLTLTLTIGNWLNGSRDYNTGLRIYLEHGKDQNLRRLFTSEGFSPFKQQKLLTALQELLAGQAGVITTRIHTGAPSSETVPEDKKSTDNVNKLAPDANKLANKAKLPRRWSEAMDLVERALYDKWKPLYSEMLDLQARIGPLARQAEKDALKDQEASTGALRMLELDRMCDHIYQERNYYLEHKKLPDVKSDLEIDPDPLTWPTRLSNHTRYLRDYKAKLRKEHDPDKRIKLSANIEYQEKMITEYKRLLNKK
jgi:hypothetical protein